MLCKYINNILITVCFLHSSSVPPKDTCTYFCQLPTLCLQVFSNLFKFICSGKHKKRYLKERFWGTIEYYSRIRNGASELIGFQNFT